MIPNKKKDLTPDRDKTLDKDKVVDNEKSKKQKENETDVSEKKPSLDNTSLDVVNGVEDLVRGVNKTTFKASFTASDEIAEQAWTLFKNKDWSNLEQLCVTNNINPYKGKFYPPNEGFVSVTESSLHKGFEFDRYGGKYIDGEFTDGGKYVAPKGASFESRALPDDVLNSPKKSYKVIKEIPNIKEGPAIPWFGKEGNGMQYNLEFSIDELKANGFIIEI